MRQLPTNDLIREVLGVNHPRPLGWQILVETYNFGDKFVNEDGSQSVFERPDSAKERDHTQLSVGRILMMGSAVFKDKKFETWDLIPIVGDWVSFKRYAGDLKVHGSKFIQYLDDLSIKAIEPDPSMSGYTYLRGI